eukprot:180141-Rhodomonas_salina.1
MGYLQVYLGESVLLGLRLELLFSQIRRRKRGDRSEIEPAFNRCVRAAPRDVDEGDDCCARHALVLRRPLLGVFVCNGKDPDLQTHLQPPGLADLERLREISGQMRGITLYFLRGKGVCWVQTRCENGVGLGGSMDVHAAGSNTRSHIPGTSCTAKGGCLQ